MLLSVAFFSMDTISTCGELLLSKSNRIIYGKVPFPTKNPQKYKPLFVDFIVKYQRYISIADLIRENWLFQKHPEI